MKLSFHDFEPQGETVSALIHQIRNGSLFHALLILGKEGIGKKTLAGLLSKSVLCTSIDHKPCGLCSSCRQLELSGEHPDQIIIRTDSGNESNAAAEKDSISIASIRDMIHRASIHPSEGEHRVVIIQDSEKMTTEAQNALLKILEDPPEGTCFFLLCQHQDQLLPTIVSRCLPVRLHSWSDQYIENVLIRNGIDTETAHEAALLADGSIGSAYQIASDNRNRNLRNEVYLSFFREAKRSNMLEISNEWKDRKGEASLLFSILEGSVSRMLKAHATDSEEEYSKIRSLFSSAWADFAFYAKPEDFTCLFDVFFASRQQVQASVNFQAVIDQILFSLLEAQEKCSR